MNPRLEELYRVIELANIEIAEIRKECNHETYTVEMYSWRPGSFHPQRICTNCGAVVEGITDDEAKLCNAKFSAPITSGVIYGTDDGTA